MRPPHNHFRTRPGAGKLPPEQARRVADCLQRLPDPPQVKGWWKLGLLDEAGEVALEVGVYNELELVLVAARLNAIGMVPQARQGVLAQRGYARVFGLPAGRKSIGSRE